MTDLPASLGAAVMLGVLSSLHCLGMCGGIMAALGSRSRSHVDLLTYQAGRLTSYGLLGLMVGALGAGLSQAFPGLGPMLRAAAGLLLVLMGVHQLGLAQPLAVLERGGSWIWRRLQGGLGRASLRSSFTVGLLWGWLPCGLVYSVAAWALLMGDPLRSALLMVAFGVGTLPAALAASESFSRLLRLPAFRHFAGVALIAFGCWTVVGGLPMIHGGGHGGHHAHTPGRMTHPDSGAATPDESTHAGHGTTATGDSTLAGHGAGTNVDPKTAADPTPPRERHQETHHERENIQ